MLRLGGIAAAGAAGAALMTAVDASPAEATTGTMVYGTAMDAETDTTQLSSNVAGDFTFAVFTGGTAGGAFRAFSEGTFPAVQGENEGEAGSSGIGVFGLSDFNDGVKGQASGGAGLYTGVAGVHGTGSGSVNGTVGESHSGIGVYGLMGGHTALSGPAGVCGDSAAGIGVRGVSTTGIGVLAQSAGTSPASKAIGKTVPAGGAVAVAGNGAALTVQGVAAFTRSNIATIAAAATSVVVSVPGGLTASSHVLATMQTTTASNVGVKSATPNAATGKITIALTAAAPAGGIKVAWFVFG